jgi:hypothetical protein
VANSCIGKTKDPRMWTCLAHTKYNNKESEERRCAAGGEIRAAVIGSLGAVYNTEAPEMRFPSWRLRRARAILYTPQIG